MANDFYTVQFVNQLGENAPFGVNVIIPNDDKAKWEPFPERDETGKINLRMEQPTDSERHTVLGQFMDAWSKVEMAMATLLQELLSTDSSNIPALMNSLGTRGQLDVLNELGAGILDNESFIELAAIMGRIKTNNTRRNYIAHGYWLLEILIRNHGGQPALVYHQIRAYDPTTQEERQKLRDRSTVKVRLKYHYTLARLRSLSRELHSIWHDLTSFTGRHFRPKPVE